MMLIKTMTPTEAGVTNGEKQLETFCLLLLAHPFCVQPSLPGSTDRCRNSVVVFLWIIEYGTYFVGTSVV
jgi:hypothetical protein